MGVGRFLPLAVALSAALGQLHGRGLIHKDINPANVIVDSAAEHVWLTGFGIASRLPRERQAPEPPEIIAGTLAYMAPEQTGRMNRSVDARSDLYALGVTFYQMVTGVLPFAAVDPMELVHCHIARQAVPPAERTPGVPAAISAVIMKLLAKTQEDRYQTAAGVDADLRRCLTAYQLADSIEPFALAAHDIPDVLRISEQLYGRERSIEALLAAFERVTTEGSSELMLVSGYSGVGKSSVVNELQKALSLSRGIFAAGKCDQLTRDIPYATLGPGTADARGDGPSQQRGGTRSLARCHQASRGAERSAHHESYSGTGAGDRHTAAGPGPATARLAQPFSDGISRVPPSVRPVPAPAGAVSRRPAMD